MPPVTTRAVVLRAHDYGDSSRILRFYTESFGLLSVVAHGVRGRAGKGGGHVSSFATEINPNSLEVLTDARVEPAVAADNSPAPAQFERMGYFARDPDSKPGKPVFNRTVGLRDTFAKEIAKG